MDPRERAAVDVAASALRSLRDARSLTNSEGGVGVELSAGAFDLKRRRIVKVGDRMTRRLARPRGRLEAWPRRLLFDLAPLPRALSDSAEALRLGKPFVPPTREGDSYPVVDETGVYVARCPAKSQGLNEPLGAGYENGCCRPGTRLLSTDFFSIVGSYCSLPPPIV